MPEALSPKRWRLAVIGAMTVVILAFVNIEIAGKERIVRDGTPVLLELAPVDPRSLLQGDYMALRYAMSREVAQAAAENGVEDGRVVIELDEAGVARFIRIYQGGKLGHGQHLLQFRKRGESVRLASDAWFFEEGTAVDYRDARFGELRVAEDGAAVLVGVRESAAGAADSPPQPQSSATAAEFVDRRVVGCGDRKCDGTRRHGVEDDSRHACARDALAAVLAEQPAMPVYHSPRESAWDVGRRRAERDEGSFSYRNTTVIEDAGKAAACLIGYDIPDDPQPIPPDMPPMFVPLQELENLAPATWYVNVLAVLPEHRNKGYGTRLLALADETGRKLGKRGMSVIVADANTGARRLYERCGYVEKERRPMVKDGWQTEGREWVLLVKAF